MTDRATAPMTVKHIGGCVCAVCLSWYPPGWNLHPNVRRDLSPVGGGPRA